MNDSKIRPELGELPVRMRNLPVDERGYPVPWFVDWVRDEDPGVCPIHMRSEGNGYRPEFRAMSRERWTQAVYQRLCWVCGGGMGTYKTFVAGPMCGINRTSAEPPSHQECARWSAVNCPFLNNPSASRRNDELLNGPMKAPGFALERNPGVTLLWTTKSYSLFRDHNGGALITMGDPDSVEWFCEGRQATRAEVLHSIDGGMPALMQVAMTEEGAVQELFRMRANFIRDCVKID